MPVKPSTFNGFPKDVFPFLKDLRKNNERPWFHKNKDRYMKSLIDPSKAFIDALGEKLGKIMPTTLYDPRVNGSIFRLNRDMRFSKDKTPYKTNLGILFWDASGERKDSTGFYFHLEPGSMMLGTGYHIFPKDILQSYRDAVVHDIHGKKLVNAIRSVSRKGVYGLGGVHYKRIPRGYDPEHANAELLKHNGIYFMFETKPPKELYSPKIVDYCLKHFKAMMPLHKWLVDMQRRGNRKR